MVAQSHTHNKINEINALSAGGQWVVPEYDAVGNTTTLPSVPAPNIERLAMYDAWNRMVQFNDDADTLAKYVYDARGFRIQKEVYVSNTHTSTRDYFYTSSWLCIEEQVTDESTTTTTLDREYVWGLRYIDDLVRRDRDTTGNGTLDEQLFALNNRQFNVVALWDATAASGAGAIVERFTYDPYDQPLASASAGCITDYLNTN